MLTSLKFIFSEEESSVLKISNSKNKKKKEEEGWEGRGVTQNTARIREIRLIRIFQWTY